MATRRIPIKNFGDLLRSAEVNSITDYILDDESGNIHIRLDGANVASINLDDDEKRQFREAIGAYYDSGTLEELTNVLNVGKTVNVTGDVNVSGQFTINGVPISFEETGATIEDWDEVETYDVGDLVIYNGNIYSSLVASNIANIPPDSGDNTNWSEVSATAPATIPDWEAGVYLLDNSVVVSEFRSQSPLFRLVAETPYTSSNIIAEFEAGDWEIVGMEPPDPFDGIEIWREDGVYVENDLVVFQGHIFRLEEFLPPPA